MVLSSFLFVYYLYGFRDLVLSQMLSTKFFWYVLSVVLDSSYWSQFILCILYWQLFSWFSWARNHRNSVRMGVCYAGSFLRLKQVPTHNHVTLLATTYTTTTLFLLVFIWTAAMSVALSKKVLTVLSKMLYELSLFIYEQESQQFCKQ